MTVTDGLKNIQPTLCDGNFYESIDKIFLVRKYRSMGKVFLLFMGMLSCGACMRAEPGLKPLSDLYEIHQGIKLELWPKVLEETKDFVEKALQGGSDPACANRVALEDDDLGTIEAFLGNRSCLEYFLESEYFIEGEHTPLLINLFRLGYKAAASFDTNIVASEGYAYVFSGDSIDILKLCAMGSNIEARNAILWSGIFAEDC